MPALHELHALLESSQPDTWAANLFSLAKRFGFDRVLIGMVKNQTTPFEDAFLRSNYPDEWRAIYVKSRLHSVDPVVLHSLKSTLPIAWMGRTFSNKAHREFYKQAAGFGLRCGITYPMHGAGGEFGMISFVSSNADHDIFRGDSQSLARLAFIRDYAQESALRFSGDNAAAPQATHLTPRELECVQWIAAGKSSWEISVILKCSEATINFHVLNLMRKFRVYTRQQAVVRAIRERLIVPL